MEYNTGTKFIEHPLEEALDIESGTTLVEYKEAVPAEIVEMPNYDAKDNEIEQKLEEIYTIAMDQADQMGVEMVRVEGKYKARLGEVTATMLNVALGVVREKTALKVHKDRTATSSPTTVNTTYNNLIVADRNEALKLAKERKRQRDESGSSE